VHASRKRDNLPARELSGYERASMTDHGRLGQIRNVGKWNAYRIDNLVGKPTKTGSKDDRNFRR
jgi:hypothetical protein